MRLKKNDLLKKTLLSRKHDQRFVISLSVFVFRKSCQYLESCRLSETCRLSEICRLSDVFFFLNSYFSNTKIHFKPKRPRNVRLLFDNENIQRIEQFKTFHPDPRQFHSIEVTPNLPITLWGHHLPNIRNSTFSLPWFTTNDKVAKDKAKA